MQRNWVFATNSNFLIFISLQPDILNLWYFKLILFDLTELIHSFKYLRSATLGSKDKGIITKSEFVAQTQFLIKLNWVFSHPKNLLQFFSCFFSCVFLITTKRFGSSWSIPTFAKYDMERSLEFSILLYFVLMDLMA